MDITTIIQRAHATAAEYLALPVDQRPEPDTFAQDGYAKRVADWRGFGATDIPFQQFTLAFGLAVTMKGHP